MVTRCNYCHKPFTGLLPDCSCSGFSKKEFERDRTDKKRKARKELFIYKGKNKK